MAILEVGGGSQRVSKSGPNVDLTTQAFPGNVTAGNLLLVIGNNFHTGGSTITVSDTLGTSYTVLQSNPYTDHASFIAYGIAPSSGANTVTVDPTTTGNYISFALDEFSGVDQVTPLDQDGDISIGTGTAVSDTVTTATANALVVGVTGHTGVSITGITPGGSYTQIGEQEDNNSQEAYNAVFRLVTTAQLYTVDWTLATSRSWWARTAAFREGGQPSPVIVGKQLRGWIYS